MSEDSLALKFLDTITLSIAGEVTTWVNRKVVESEAVRRFKSNLGIDEINSLTKDILKASISDSFIKVQSSKTAIKNFLKDEKNKKILSEWVVNPKTIGDNEVELVKKYAINDSEKMSLDIFIEHLKKNIRINREKRFPPDARQILDELNAVKEDVEEFKQTSEVTLSEVQKFGSEQATKEDIESLRTLISTLGVREKLDDEVSQSQIDNLEKLIEDGAIIDAREKALSLLAKAEKGNVQFICRLNRLVATTYLKEESNQQKAILYLKESAECCDDEGVIYRNRSLALLLEKRLDEALDEADKLISHEENVDSLGLKANILWVQGRTQEAFNLLVKKEYEDDYKHFHNISYSAFVNGDIDTAYEYAKKSIELNGDFIEGLELLSSIIARKYQQKVHDADKIWPNGKDLDQLIKARGYSTKAIQLINHQRKDQVRRLLTNRGIVNHWLGDDQDAIEDLEKAKENKIDDIVILKNLSLLYATIDNYDQALKYIDKLFELDYKDQDLVRIKSQILISQGKSDQVIEFLKGELDLKKINKNKLELYSILVFAFDRSLLSEDSERLLESLEKEYPDSPVVLYAKVKHLHLMGEYEECIQLSLVAEEKAAGKTKILLKLERADVLFEKKDKDSFIKAAEIYAEFCNENHNDYLLRRYALCLFNSRQYVECLRICKKIQQDGPINLFTKIEGEIYYYTQNFIPAKESFKWLSKREPERIGNFIKYAVCLYRLNRPQKAYQIVRRVANKVEGSASDLLNIAFTFAQIGKTKEAAEYSDKAIQVGSNNVNINMGYIVLWIRHIQNIDGIPDELIKNFQVTLHSFNEKFPEQEDFIELIETPVDDVESLKKEILERLPSKEWREEIQGLFQEKKYPVELLSKLTGRDIYSTWDIIINHPNCGLFSNSGDRSNLQDQIRIIASNESILLGPVALFTINKIGLVNQLLGQFEKIYVPQITLDIFRNIVKSEKLSIKNGGMTIYESEGKIYRQDLSSELIETRVNAIEKMIEILSSEEKHNGKIELIGESLSREKIKIKQDYEENLESIGEITTEMFFESSSKGIPAYCEDYGNRIIGKEEFGTKSFGTRPLLEMMFYNGVISDDEYHDSLIELIKLNYHFINISTDTLKRLAKKNGYVVNKEIFTILDEFRRPNQLLGDLLSLSTNFLRWIWDEIDHDETRKKWTLSILNAVSHRRNKKNIATYFEEFAEQGIHELDTIKKKKVKELVQTWEKAQIIL